MEYYDDFDHIGYNIRGEKIMKPPKKDQLDEYIDREDNPYYWYVVGSHVVAEIHEKCNEFSSFLLPSLLLLFLLIYFLFFLFVWDGLGEL